MNHEISLTVPDTGFEAKVVAIAVELLNILKELSRENIQQINSRTISEKMLWNDSVKRLLANDGSNLGKDDIDNDRIRKLANIVISKFVEIAPPGLTDEISELQDRICKKSFAASSTEWLDTPVSSIKKYIDSISFRNNALEKFIKQTIENFEETDNYLSRERYFRHQKYRSDRDFEVAISDKINQIRHNVAGPDHFEHIKTVLLNNIDSMYEQIKNKKEMDILRLKEADSAMEHMDRQLQEIRIESGEISRRAREIEYESVLDGLTGLYNRKAYDQKIIKTLADLHRYNVTASLIVCDIDNFKKINDTFGHSVGDLALKKFGTLLKKRLRVNDYIARYGGDEFVIILPHTDLDGANRAGEGICTYIDTSRFSYKRLAIPVTISAGISSFKKGDDSYSVFERADTALYLAKRSGRNQVRTENDIHSDMVVFNQDYYEF